MNETFFDVELKKNQEYIINKILSVGGILAFSIVIVVFIRDFPDKINVYFFIEAFLTVFALFIALFNKMFSLMFKVIFIVLALYLTFATSLYSNGFATPSKAYFIVTPVLVSFILSFKRTMVLLAIFSFTYFMFSYLYIYNFIKITQFNNKYPQLFLTWLVDGTVYIVSSFCIIYIINLFKNFNFSKIHELFTLKETLQKSEINYRQIFNFSNDAYFIQDIKTGNVLDVNETMLEMYGYTHKKDVVTKQIFHFSAQDKGYNGEKALEYISKLTKTDKVSFEWLAQKQDSSQFWVEVTLKIIQLYDKECILATVKNINDNKIFESAIKKQENIFRTIFDKSTDGNLLIDSGVFIDCNEAVLHLLKINSKAEVIGKHPWDISPEFQDDSLTSIKKAEIMLKITLDNGFHRFEWKHLTKFNEIVIFDIVLTTVQINNKDLIHCVWRDISQQKQKDVELQQYRKSLERMVQEKTYDLEQKNAVLHEALENLKNTQFKLIQSDKMASLGVLTAGVAHEINNPLNYIMGSYYGLKDYFEKLNQPISNDTQTLLESLKLGVERASEIIQSLNQFSRSNLAFNEDCIIHEILDNCLLVLNNQLKHRIRIDKSYSTDLIQCKGNVGKLHQAFLNILSNASHAILEKGIIEIKTYIYNDKVYVEISDNGIGIKQEDIHKITDPFYTTKDPGKGTGLGLSITYSIVKDHNGDLEFDSKENEGTKVLISLPFF